MFRLALALVLATPVAALADSCSVSGTAYDASGKPMRALVRLVDLDSMQAAFSETDDHAAFSFNAALPGGTGGRYRLDVLSRPTIVVGTHIPTRSILGMSDSFSCRGMVRQDVHAQID